MQNINEALEERVLLAAPTLVAVRPNIGEFLQPNEIRNEAPKELTLQFNPGQQIDASTVSTDTILVERSGHDGNFGDGNEVPVSLGFVGIGDSPEEVVLRFAENLANDHFRITIKGAGDPLVDPVLKNVAGEVFNDGADDTFDFQLDLGAQVVAVVPMPISGGGSGTLTQARDQIVVHFNEDDLDVSSAENRDFYQLIFTSNTVENTDDLVFKPKAVGGVSYDLASNTATLTFDSDIELLAGPGTYRLRIGTDEPIPMPPTQTAYEETLVSDFGSAGDATVTIDANTSIDGNPITINFTSGVGLGNGVPAVVVTGRTIDIDLDATATPTTASQLVFAINLNPDASALVAATVAGNLLSPIGATAPPSTFMFRDSGSSFADGDDLGELTSQSRIVTGRIRSLDYPFDFPGNDDEPGHRDIDVPREDHVLENPDRDREITTLTYNFQTVHGTSPLGVPLPNNISPAQKQRAREIFELYGNYLGVQFIETENLGFTIATGDLRPIDPFVYQLAGGVAANGVTSLASRNLNLAIMDGGETWDDSFGGSWFSSAMHQIGILLGLGNAYELPDLTVMGAFAGNNDTPAVEVTGAEPDFPGDHDIVHGQLLYRPDSKDIDLYKFNVTDAGKFTAETIAERLTDSSLLDTTLRLFREDPISGKRTLISQNDDYVSEDSLIEITLQPGVYYLGVTASGNDAYNPAIRDSGLNGTTQGRYELRLNFRPNADSSIVDTSNTAFDGDLDGLPGGEFNFWFRATAVADQLVVDRTAPAGGNGALATPFNEIDLALAAATPGQIVRIVGNPGIDGDISPTPTNPMATADNVAYQIGLDDGGFALRDGASLEIPQDVVVMIDAGALLKFSDTFVSVGSSSSLVNRSGATLQVLGTPDADVIFTSWRDETVGQDTTPGPTTPQQGNWGGVVYRRDVDNEESNLNYERLGIFMDYMAFANMSYGGGIFQIDSIEQVINPITLIQSRPGIYNNVITLSEDAAISADPDSFLETTFHSPFFQQVAFTTDYGRIGPDFYGNRLFGNTTNGLLVRVQIAPNAPLRELTVAGRFDDVDLVHVISENLMIRGTPGGPFLETKSPSVVLTTATPQTLPAGTLLTGTYNYRIAFVDAGGTTSPGSVPTRTATVAAGQNSVALGGLPPAPAPFTGRLLYRSDRFGNGPYELIANLDASDTTYVDDGTTLTGFLNESLIGRNRARTDARLAIDSDVIVKLDNARIEVGVGATFIAEGNLGREIILTSKSDDRYGAGGTFDTNNDGEFGVGAAPAPGNWGGLYLSPVSSASLDHVLLTFGGGTIPTDNDFAKFNVIEVHQADLRLTNSLLESNDDGLGGTAPADRFGRTANAAGSVFVRGAQPVIADNIFRNNAGAAININANALTSAFLSDYGRSRGMVSIIGGFEDNQGPAIAGNTFAGDTLDSINTIHGMIVRGETLTTQTVWDDTSLVHVLRDEIVVENHHTFSGLRLNSSPDASLVVKLANTVVSPTVTIPAGFTAGGTLLDIDDRIGGVVQVVGQPFFPVIITALADDSVGAGFDTSGLPLNDTNDDGDFRNPKTGETPASPAPGAWRSILITQNAHDRNVRIYNENESSNAPAPGTNGTAAKAEFLGELGKQSFRFENPDGTHELQKAGDENLRLGFEINGTINIPGDVDVYSFKGTAGMEVWLDIDRTTHAFDTVVELISGTNQLIAQSDNSLDEGNGLYPVFVANPLTDANPLHKSLYQSDDWYSTNQRDAGMRIILPGVVGSTGTYQVRVRSSNIDSRDPLASRADLQDPAKVNDGITTGSYQLQIRLQEADEVAGTSVRYADIRYATNGIEIYGQPVHSPLAGEYTERTTGNNDNQGTAENLGNLLNTDRAAISLAGSISAPTDVDFYRFSVRYEDLNPLTPEAVQDIDVYAVPRSASVTFDVDYADGLARANLGVHIFDAATGRLILTARDSNIADDRSGPGEGGDYDDLSRGSAGNLDPFIGPFELPEGDYIMVVAPHSQIPQVLGQTMLGSPVDQNIRLEPVSSVKRIADEHFGGFGTPTTPLYDLYDNEAGQNLTPYHFGDVNLFVSDSGENLYTVNPFTGALTSIAGNFGSDSLDIAMRADGQLYNYRFTAAADANASGYGEIDTGNAARTGAMDETIVTYRDSDPDPMVFTEAVADVGMVVTAFGYAGTGTNDGRFVATRGDGSYLPNLLYAFNITTGVAVSNGPARAANARATQNNIPTPGNPSGTAVREIAALTSAGFITGIAIDPAGTIFAVDTAGFLTEFMPDGTFVQSAAILDPDGNPAEFSGLALGPDEVEGGRYGSTLFATDSNGNYYALAGTGPTPFGMVDPFGAPQPIFVDGQSVLNIGLAATGLDFSTLDRNLWSGTGLRAGDTGHGMGATPDGLRQDTPGGASLYFGNQRGGRAAGNQNNLQTAPINDFNFPGGAAGSFITNTFSLEGYSQGDNPTLYFNYLVDTASLDYIPGVRPHSDSIRAYVGDGSSWNLVATNDSYRGIGVFNDEQDWGYEGNVTQNPTTQLFPDVVELYDETVNPAWRQARIDLSNYAGRDDLRIRFEFASSGSVNVGDISTVGEELYVKSGSDHRDGQSWILEGVNEFEFDFGHTLVAVDGSQISDGETFTIAGTTFEFEKSGGAVTGIPVVITDTMSGTAVAEAMERAIDAAAIPMLQTHRDANRINVVFFIDPPGIPPLPPNQIDTNVPVSQSAGAAVVLEGAPGSTPGTTPVPVHAGLTRAEVGEIVAQRLADHHLPSGTYREAEFNNAPDPMLAQDLEALSWTADLNHTVTDSATLPHISIIATSEPVGGTDYYRFLVPAGGGRVVADIDGTAASFDSLLRIVDDMGVILYENNASGVLDVASNHTGDTFLDVMLPAGEYYVQVGVPPTAGGASPGQRYTLHVSVAGHAVDANGPTVPLVVDRLVVKNNHDLVRVIGHYVTTAGPLGLTTFLPGDEFGGFYGSQPSLRGSANAFQGVFIDDIVIGTTERGEMVTNRALGVNTTQFMANPEVNDPFNTNPYLDTLDGAYDVEIRTSADYVYSSFNQPGRAGYIPFESNARWAQQQSFQAPAAANLVDGMTFSLTDGVDTVVFEYDDVNSGDNVEPGRFPILFNPIALGPDGDFTGESAAVIAGRIRDAINSPAVQGVLDVSASLADGAADSSFSSSSSLVNIYGTAQFTLTDGQQPRGSSRTPVGVSGQINAVGNSLGSNALFSFTNTSTIFDPATSFPERIDTITIQLPAGRHFDPSFLLEMRHGGTGPAVHPSSDFGTPSFTTFDPPDVPVFSVSPLNDILTIQFDPSRGDGFDQGDLLLFGIDLDSSPEPLDYLGTIVNVTFSTGRVETAQFVKDANANITASLRPISDTSSVVVYDRTGDQNRFRDQGQILVDSNIISDSLGWGIISDEGQRTGPPLPPLAGNLPHQGPVRSLREPNQNRLVPGVVIMNNLITHSGAGGIRFSGDTATAVPGVVAYGRILNNTVYGDGAGVGIQVEQNSSPTVLNNILADLTTGISVDAGSQALGTVIGYSLYRNAPTALAVQGTDAIILNAGDPLFVDEANRNFYPAPFSKAIDSALDGLGARTLLTTVIDQLGIDPSLIRAPLRDVFGQFRGDDPDVSTADPTQVKDRGAIDRVDFFRPTATLTNPLDQAATDLDPLQNTVWINEPEALRDIIVTLSDVGIGINDSSINKDQFALYQDDVLLIEGVDYIWVYNATNNDVIFRSVTQFPFETRYRVEVDNDDDIVDGDGIDGVRDLAGNYLAPNEGAETLFHLLVTDGINDPPINTVPPGVQTTNEDTDLVFNAANGNKISVSDADVHLGDNRLKVTLTATNGVITLSQTTGLVFTPVTGTGIGEATMTFEGDVADINAALDGLFFSPDPDYVGAATLKIKTEDQGQFTAPPSPPMMAMNTINIDVLFVNDNPTFDLPADPPAVDEDAVPQPHSVLMFVTNISAGDPNESTQMVTFELTVLSTTGNLTFSTLDIDEMTGELTYSTDLHTNGVATIQAVLRDDLGAGSVPVTFDITVNPINDEPVYTLNTASHTSLEDDGVQTVDLLDDVFPGPPEATDELATQTVLFDIQNITTTSLNLTFTQLTIAPDGTLTYRATPETAGSATFELRLIDTGPGTAPDDNTAGPLLITINVTPQPDPPTAVTPNYVIDEGDTLVLDASGSSDPDVPHGDMLTYRWDLNGDGDFTDLPAVTTTTLSVPWTTLQAFGITAPGVFPIGLKVTDAAGAMDVDTATLTTLIVDYGDAPDSYGTLKAPGAAHTITASGPILGATIDREMNGQPTPGAIGDGADEDGVVFHTNLESDAVLDLPTAVTVTASQNAKLDIWLDLDGNGSFDPVSEHLNGGTSFDVVAGTQVLPVTIPAGSAIGNTIMRFRISTAGSLAPTGRAADGEVEDYQVEIKPLSTAVVPTVTKPFGPDTSDLTPVVEWTQHPENWFHDVVVKNASGTPVFTRNGVSGNSLDVTVVLAAGSYTAEVTAYNRAGVSAGTFATRAFQVVPQMITAPGATALTHRPTISWNEIVGSIAYQLQVDNLSTGVAGVIQELNLPGALTSFVPTSDLPLGRYRVQVRAIDGCNHLGDWSPFSEFAVKAPPVITAPMGTTTNVNPVLVWTPVPGATRYEIVVNNVTDNIPNVVQLNNVTSTSFTVPTNLSLGLYEFRVRAFNASNDASEWSPFTQFTVQTQPVAASPFGLVDDSTPTIAWGPLAAADSYRLEVLQKFGAESVILDQTGIVGNSFTITSQLPLGRYRYRITGFNGNVASLPTGFHEFVVATRPTVTAPVATTFDATPDLAWNAPFGAATHEVWLQQVGGVLEYIRVSGLSTATFTPPSDLPIGSYILWVRSSSLVDPTVQSLWSLGRRFKVATPPELLSPVREERVVDNTPTLEWLAVTGGQTYEVWLSNITTGLRVLYETNLDATNFTVPDPLSIGRHVFWARARNAFGEFSAWSNPNPFTVVSAPTLLSPPASTFDRTPTFTWEDLSPSQSGLTTYEVRVDNVTLGIENYHRVSGISGTAYTIPDAMALPDGQYRAYVRSNAGNAVTTDWSPVKFFYVGGRPEVTNPGTTTDTTPTFTWKPVQGAVSYQIFVSKKTSENVPVINVVNISASSYTATTPLAKDNYRVWVRAISSTGEVSIWSVVRDFTIADADVDSSGDSEELFAALEMSGVDAIGMLPTVVATDSTAPVTLPAIVIHREAMLDAQTEVAATDVTTDEETQLDDVMVAWTRTEWWDQPAEPAAIVPTSSKNDPQDEEDDETDV